ncbi:amidohydrolase family protein [Treponema sp. OMZ 840]|uniref:amidohydrolase family protein n=1 Tax=Treponema sp. OMZ 840 TaxID=244313 RepID=UPI003D91981F
MKIFASRILAGPELEVKINQVLVVENGKIVSIQDGLPEGADIVLDGDITLMPGMIDCHSHLALDARIPNHLGTTDDSEKEQLLRALKSARDNLAAGITGLRCVGDRYYIDVMLRDLQKNGNLNLPWMQVAGIGMKGLHGHGYVGKGFSGAEDFRRQSRENIYHKTDWLKIFMSPGLPPLEENKSVDCFLMREEVRTVVEEARNCGLKVSAHCIGGKGLEHCLCEGVDIIDHCYWITDTEIESFIKHNACVCFTSGIIMDDSRLPMLSSDHADKILKIREESQKRLSRFVAAKPRFVIGSDAYHGLLYREIECMLCLGMDIKEALKGITVYAAQISDRMTGQLTVGYDADLIAVSGNPLSDCRALSKVNKVFLHGNIIETHDVFAVKL